MKGQAIADHLVDLPLPEYQPLQTQFPNEDIFEDKLQWHLYVDGTVNRMGKGIGAVLATPQEQLIPFARKMTFPCTNNEAEYEACILGLQVALEHGV